MLLNLFLKRVADYGFCSAFTATLVTNEDAKNIDALMRKHINAKVIVLFAQLTLVEMLMETIRLRSIDLGQEVPRIWIGNDKWGGAVDLANREPEKYRPIMQAVFGLWPTIPSHFNNFGFQPPPIAKIFERYILSINAGDLRKNPSITGNPLFCRVMEDFSKCSGVCPSSRMDPSKPRCTDNTTLPVTFPGIPLKISSLVEPATMFAAAILVEALQNIFQRTVDKHPNLSRDEIIDRFHENAQGEKLRKVLQAIKFPCNDVEECRVFPGSFHELIPEYSIFAQNINFPETIEVGFWRAGDFQIDDAHVSMELDAGLVSFGKNVYHAELQKGLPSFVSGNAHVPTSTCNPKCLPGWGVQPAPEDEPVCCHVCAPCTNREYSPGGTISMCQRCPPGYSSAPEHRECHVLPVIYFTDEVLIVVWTVVAVFVLAVAATMAIVRRYSNTPLVRSSDRMLTGFALVAMVMGCVGIAVRTVADTVGLCVASRLLASLSTLVLSGALLVKTSRFARIQRSATKCRKTRSAWSFSNKAQVVFLCLSAVPGAILETVTIAVSPPSLQNVYKEDVTYEVCSFSDAAVITVDVYFLVLLAVTVFLAFYTRKLPLNYNEANLLFLASFSQSAVWAVLRPLYYLAEPNTQQLFDIVLVFLNMAALWLWVFLPRLYLLLFNKDRRNRYAGLRKQPASSGSYSNLRYISSTSLRPAQTSMTSLRPTHTSTTSLRATHTSTTSLRPTHVSTTSLRATLASTSSLQSI